MDKCVFCVPQHEVVIYKCDICRVIIVDNPYYVGYLQVISNVHAKELTNLPLDNAKFMLNLLLTLELRLRQIFNPDKINIACFGNMVPHVHFHIIPRFKNDRHFPNPIWGEVTNDNYHPSEILIGKQQQLQNINL